MTRRPRPLTAAEKEHLIASCWCRRTDEPCRECRRYLDELGRCRCADAGAARASDGWRCLQCGRRIDGPPGAAA